MVRLPVGIRVRFVLALSSAALTGVPRRLSPNSVSMRISSPQGIVATHPLDSHRRYVALCIYVYRRTKRHNRLPPLLRATHAPAPAHVRSLARLLHGRASLA